MYRERSRNETHYLTLDIVSDGELFLIQREVPEVFAVSSGPMSMHSALIGTVSRMLEHLCCELWQAEKGS